MELEKNKATETTKQTFVSFSDEEREFSSVVERLIEQWGFKPLLGRVWTLLYMRAEPMNPTQVEAILHLSKGNVNSLLNELLMWGVIKKVRVENDRNYYYEVEDQIWKSISNVVQAREARILAEAVEQTKNLERTISHDNSLANRDYKLDRIGHVREALEIFQTVTNLLLKASPDKLTTMAKWISRLRRF